MARAHKKSAPVVANTPAPVVETPRILEDLRQEQLDDAEIEGQIALPRSVVKPKYKVKYRDRARANGQTKKAAKRSAWDWLAQQLAGEVLDERSKLKVDAFLALLDANGVDHSRWTNRSPGWEGRLRMTGRLALQRVVAEAGVLCLADGEQLEAPAEWVAKFLN
jgi:hypothetical protein